MKLLAWILVAMTCAAGAADAQDVCAPSKVTNLTISTGRTTAVGEWTNVGDDCSTGNATTVEVRASTSPITEANYFSATIVYSATPGGPGSGACFGLSAGGAFQCNTTYYWALKTIDDAGNYSPISNVVQRATQSCNINEPEIDC